MAVPQQPRFNRFVRKLFNMKSGYDPSVLEDFFPTFEMAMRIMPDLLRSREEKLWGAFKSVGAVVGAFGQVFIGNLPANTISVIEWLYVTGGAGPTGNWFAALPNTVNFPFPVAGNAQANFADSRETSVPNNGTQATQTILGTATTGAGLAIANAILLMPLQSAPNFLVPCNIIIQAPRNLVIQTDTVNNALGVMAYGYERLIEPSEAAL